MPDEKKPTAATMQTHNQWEKELEKLAAILHRTTLVPAIKWGAEVFTYNGKNVVSYGGFKNFFTLWFYNGVFIKDKYNVLINASEGKTKSLRQWRMATMQDIDEKKIMEYIQEAIAIEEKGLKIAPEKTPPPPLPALLLAAFSQNNALKNAFEKLTPGCRKEYILYINEARQDATKLRRIEKITPMVLEKKGLHDKYKNCDGNQ